MPTRQEQEEKGRNALCIWCGVKFINDHKCLRSQLYHMLMENELDTNADVEFFFVLTVLIL